ncbi:MULTISPECIES: PLDc N-terminal domain-containing protein [Nocardiopsis]|uniref:PLDc N-terminal domain-containing protein n=2 Tax=Nocardiopsis alba TaxID=53437 RepID=A0A7K2J0T8_9ACTN|nr:MULTISPECIES: PLDc N-terminal domain-containing protein [Nocardiopsis]AFR08988.1 hypothetical protein B005_5142 [Nocardiopsis alba ATCC BAA-2165]MEC3890934.1 PLDc N-terminal domain-containing protein [Nocardiopsis sp. LDBS1602]MYR35697.1 hypothetical protein [Nocardiopsis alba]
MTTVVNMLSGATDETLIAIVLGALVVLGFLAVVGLVVAAVFSILFSQLDGGMKIVWLILVILAPVIGALLWFLIGRSRSRSRPAYYR